ncbi:hypothetical protein GFB49_11515 [Epibacterium sp. SM1979]|uniref:HTH luxR-type domain-containing protein n=1 Tax=Tritonibacter litoralis TaxID=2662264 RepID=A0A843YI22_9RHOB|nr:autoinducer binding domain-containing protein [Tritonibacter litoralis]MQQ09084.1 hypothetical protein [Tritonibacter litoralis]
MVMSENLKRAALEEFERACPAGFAIVVNIESFQYDWVEFRYPDAWVERYVQREYILEDPTLVISKHRSGHVTWEELRQLFPDNVVMNEAKRFGLKHGNTLILNFGGMRTIASGAGKVWSEEDIKTLTAALRLLHGLHAKPHDAQLNEKQLAVLRLMADGLRDAEIAERMNVAPISIRTWRSTAQKATGTKTPAQLLAFAIRAQLI